MRRRGRGFGGALDVDEVGGPWGALPGGVVEFAIDPDCGFGVVAGVGFGDLQRGGGHGEEECNGRGMERSSHVWVGSTCEGREYTRCFPGSSRETVLAGTILNCLEEDDGECKSQRRSDGGGVCVWQVFRPGHRRLFTR